MILSADIPLRLANCNLHSGIAPGPATPPHVAVAFPHSARATTFEDMQSPVAFRHSTRSCPWRSSFQYVSQTPFCATYRLWTFPGYFRTLALAAVLVRFFHPICQKKCSEDADSCESRALAAAACFFPCQLFQIEACCRLEPWNLEKQSAWQTCQTYHDPMHSNASATSRVSFSTNHLPAVWLSWWHENCPLTCVCNSDFSCDLGVSRL